MSGACYDALMARFGRQRLFFDIDHIGVGQDFVKVLEDAVTRCSVMLVVMGKRWPETGRVGSRRIDDPGDFVRMEVAAGLRREGLRVVPVLIQGAKMPTPASLPDELKELSRRNAIELSDVRWKDDVARLVTGLEDTVISAGPSSAGPLPPWVKWAGVAAASRCSAGAPTARSRHTPAPPRRRHRKQPRHGVADRDSEGRAGTDSVALTTHRPQCAGRRAEVAHRCRADAGRGATPGDAASGESEQYEVSYAFRSPSDGAGLSVMTARRAARTTSNSRRSASRRCACSPTASSISRCVGRRTTGWDVRAAA